MVVLQLGPYPPPHGGVQTNVVAIRDHLLRSGIRAPVINLTRHRRNDADDVYYPRTAWEVMKLLVTVRADVVHRNVAPRSRHADRVEDVTADADGRRRERVDRDLEREDRDPLRLWWRVADQPGSAGSLDSTWP